MRQRLLWPKSLKNRLPIFQCFWRICFLSVGSLIPPLPLIARFVKMFSADRLQMIRILFSFVALAHGSPSPSCSSAELLPKFADQLVRHDVLATVQVCSVKSQLDEFSIVGQSVV